MSNYPKSLWYEKDDDDDKSPKRKPIPHQRDLIPRCDCDITYVCDECRKKYRPKIMPAI